MDTWLLSRGLSVLIHLLLYFVLYLLLMRWELIVCRFLNFLDIFDSILLLLSWLYWLLNICFTFRLLMGNIQYLMCWFDYLLNFLSISLLFFNRCCFSCTFCQRFFGWQSLSRLWFLTICTWSRNGALDRFIIFFLLNFKYFCTSLYFEVVNFLSLRRSNWRFGNLFTLSQYLSSRSNWCFSW